MNPGEGETSPREIRHRVVGDTPMMRASSASLSMPFARRNSSSLSRRSVIAGALSPVNVSFMRATVHGTFTGATEHASESQHSRGISAFSWEYSLHACNACCSVQFMSESDNYRQNWADYLRHMMGDRSQAGL